MANYMKNGSELGLKLGLSSCNKSPDWMDAGPWFSDNVHLSNQPPSRRKYPKSLSVAYSPQWAQQNPMFHQ